MFTRAGTGMKQERDTWGAKFQEAMMFNNSESMRLFKDAEFKM